MEAGSWAKGLAGSGRSMAGQDHQPCFLWGGEDRCFSVTHFLLHFFSHRKIICGYCRKLENVEMCIA